MGGRSDAGCVPASERLGPFGHSSRSPDADERPWDTLHWGQLQSDCAKMHFQADESTTVRRRLHPPGFDLDELLGSSRLDNTRTGRSAVVLRTWDQYNYYENQMAWMRAIATELALDTGGEFQLFILVDVKDPELDLTDDENYQSVLERSVPAEFRDLALLFNERLLREWFPKVGEYRAQDQMYQALQILSFTFPEFDYFWQLEMDARVTGNIAAMLSNTAFWAQSQPRKNLWERNSRWFIPGLWNNEYAAFAAQVDSEFDGVQREGIWGPPPNASRYITPQGPTPPSRRKTSWGVGEPADLITFAPMIDPIGTRWIYEEHVFGFDPPFELPRRMAIVSMTRTSRRLLRLISVEQRATGSYVVSESTPETFSLLHGLKAVYAPHLFAFNFGDGPMTPQELDKMVHKGPPESRAGGDKAGFLYCGFDITIPEYRWLDASYFYWAGDAPRTWWEYTNGTCTYPLLLHPVKDD